MATSDNTPIIGTQEISNGMTIVSRTPSQFPFPFPGSEDPRHDNIIFNTDDHWIITTSGPSYNSSLPEGEAYSYGGDIDVKATWWKRVQSIIWLDLSGAELTSARSDLMNYVIVNPGRFPNVSEEGKYSFFSDGDTVYFGVTEATNNVVTVSNRSYRFIGWSHEVPPFFGLPNNPPFVWDNQDINYFHQNVSFDAFCRKNEYACFINGENPEILIRTNGDNTTFWNNHDKIRYRLTWYDNVEHEQAFNSNPPIGTIPTYSGSEVNARVGRYFRVSTKNPEHEYLKDDYNTIYQLKGWYVGNFEGFDFETIRNSDEFYPYLTSQYIYVISSTTIVTAVYMPVSEQYSIIYHSGLPELQTQQ